MLVRMLLFMGLFGLLSGCETTNTIPSLAYAQSFSLNPDGEGGVSSLEWSPDGHSLLLISEYGYVGVIDAQDGNKAHSVNFDSNAKAGFDDANVVSAHWLSSAEIFIALSNGDVEIRSANLSKMLFSHRFTQWARLAKTSSSGRYIGYGNQIFDRQTASVETKSLISGEAPIGFLGEQFYLTEPPRGGLLSLWNLQTNKIDDWRFDGQVGALISHNSRWLMVKLSPFTQGENVNALHLYNARNRKLLGKVNNEFGSAVTFSSDDDWLACAGANNKLYVYSIPSLTPQYSTQFLDHRVVGITASADLLAAWDHAGELYLWNASKKRILGKAVLVGGGDSRELIKDVAIAPDQKHIAVALSSGMVKILHLDQ